LGGAIEERKESEEREEESWERGER